MAEFRTYYYKRYGGTCFIFPAMIPLIEILPWLLGLIGGVAGLLEFFRLKVWGRSRTRWGFIIGTILITTGISVFTIHHLSLPSKKEGSILVQPADVSQNISLTHTSGSPSVVVTNGFGQIWAMPTEHELTGTPAISGNVITIGTYDKTLEGRDISSGQKLWEFKKSEPLYTTSAIDGDIGVIGEGAHTAPSATLTAYSVKDGHILWARKFISHIESAGRIDHERQWIYQSIGAQGIWALDLKNGDVKWRDEIGHMDATPLYIDGRLFAVAKLSEDKDGSDFFELNPQDGKIISRVALPGDPMGDVMAGSKDTAILTTAIGQVGLNKATDKGWVHAVDIKSGKKLWTTELAAMPLPEGNVLSAKNLAFFALKDSSLVAVDLSDGHIAWTRKSGGEFRSDAVLMPDLAEPLIASVTSDGYVSILKAVDGTPVKSFKVKDNGYAAPIYKDDILYLPESRGLVAYGPVFALLKGDRH